MKRCRRIGTASYTLTPCTAIALSYLPSLPPTALQSGSIDQTQKKNWASGTIELLRNIMKRMRQVMASVLMCSQMRDCFLNERENRWKKFSYSNSCRRSQSLRGTCPCESSKHRAESSYPIWSEPQTTCNAAGRNHSTSHFYLPMLCKVTF